MDCHYLFTLKYSESEWKELKYRKIFKADLNCLELKDKFLIGQGTLQHKLPRYTDQVFRDEKGVFVISYIGK